MTDNITVRIDTYYEGGVVRLNSMYIGMPPVQSVDALCAKLKLQEEPHVDFLPYTGGAIIQNLNQNVLKVCKMELLRPSSKIGLFKGHIFCTRDCLGLLQAHFGYLKHLQVPNDDIRSFIWEGMDLVDSAPVIRKMLLNARRKNWDKIS